MLEKKKKIIVSRGRRSAARFAEHDGSARAAVRRGGISRPNHDPFGLVVRCVVGELHEWSPWRVFVYIDHILEQLPPHHAARQVLRAHFKKRGFEIEGGTLVSPAIGAHAKAGYAFRRSYLGDHIFSAIVSWRLCELDIMRSLLVALWAVSCAGFVRPGSSVSRSRTTGTRAAATAAAAEVQNGVSC